MGNYFGGEVADQFAIKLERRDCVAGQIEGGGLKIGLAAGAEVAAENEIHYIAGKGGPLEFWEDCDVEVAVAQVCFVEEWVFAGVEFAIADENEIALFGSLTAAHEDFCFGRVERAEAGPNKVAVRP